MLRFYVLAQKLHLQPQILAPVKRGCEGIQAKLCDIPLRIKGLRHFRLEVNYDRLATPVREDWALYPAHNI